MVKSIFATNTKHSRIYQFIAISFVISLGFGEIVSVIGIKLSYITTIMMICAFFYETRGKIVFIQERYKLFTYVIFCIIWGFYPLIQLLWVKNIDYWSSFYRSLFINILVIVLLVFFIQTWDDWKVISKAFIILHFTSLAVGYWEILTGHHIVHLDGVRNLSYYAFKPVSFYGNGNDNATVLFFGLCNILIFMFSHKQKMLTRLALIFLSIATISQIIIIDARGATYSLFLLLLFILYYQIKLRIDRNSKKMGKLISGFILLITVVFIIWGITAHSIEYYLSMFSGEGNYGSDVARVRIITDSFYAFLDTLGFGLGPGQSIVASRINLHNFYLEILFEYGIFVGGFLIVQIIKIGFWEYAYLPLFAKSIVKAFPFVLVLVGVSSSKTFIMRPTWILITLLLMLQFIKPNDGENKLM